MRKDLMQKQRQKASCTVLEAPGRLNDRSAKAGIQRETYQISQVASPQLA